MTRDYAHTLYAHWSLQSYKFDVNPDNNTYGTNASNGARVTLFDIRVVNISGTEILNQKGISDFNQDLPYNSTVYITNIKYKTGYGYNNSTVSGATMVSSSANSITVKLSSTSSSSLSINTKQIDLGTIKISLSYSGIDQSKSIYSKFVNSAKLYAADGVSGVFMNQTFTLHADTSASTANITKVVIDGSTGRDIQRSISNAGDYTYTATAYDSAGRSASASVTVHVFDRQHEFIILAYANGFGRNPIESGGFANWYDRIGRGESKSSIYALLITDTVNDEGYAQCGNDATCWVEMVYQTCLRRNADSDGLQTYVNLYNSTGGDWHAKSLAVANSVCNSPEAYENVYNKAGF